MKKLLRHTAIYTLFLLQNIVFAIIVYTFIISIMYEDFIGIIFILITAIFISISFTIINETYFKKEQIILLRYVGIKSKKYYISKFLSTKRMIKIIDLMKIEWDHCADGIYRGKVFNGWLLKNTEDEKILNIIYVYDKNHEWEFNKK